MPRQEQKGVTIPRHAARMLPRNSRLLREDAPGPLGVKNDRMIPMPKTTSRRSIRTFGTSMDARRWGGDAAPEVALERDPEQPRRDEIGGWPDRAVDKHPDRESERQQGIQARARSGRRPGRSTRAAVVRVLVGHRTGLM